MIFLDTETVGFQGPICLIQYAVDDGPINMWSVWKHSAIETMELIEGFMSHDGGITGFNLAFDHFHLCQMYTTLLLLPDKDAILEDVIEEYAELEPIARDGPCLKPVTCLDLMLHARKGPYQSTMDREDIRIRKVPTPLAWQLAKELERRIPLKDIYFARRKDRFAQKWQVFDIKDDAGEIDVNFKDIVLKFAPSSALKALVSDALGIQTTTFVDIELPRSVFPVEVGYAPFAKAIGQRGRWRGAWPEVIHHHIAHWSHNEYARKYASDDVDYTRKLYHFFGCPESGDDSSVLACMVGAVRWHGFKLDLDKIQALLKEAKSAKRKMVDGRIFTIPTAPKQARIYLEQVLDETSKLVIKASTKRVILEEISKWVDNDGRKPEAAIRAAEILHARQGNYEANLWEKLLRAGRFHASFVVIGTLSDRMAGGDDLNAQGIKSEATTREAFPFAYPGYQLAGGDFDGFEVTLAEAVYNDAGLRRDLMAGKSIHALFGQFVFPDMTYDEIIKTKKTSNDIYDKCKKAIFTMFYGGEGYTLKNRLGVDLEIANAAYDAFCRTYPGVGAGRRRISEMFQSMKQEGGIGTKVVWKTPKDYIESPLGTRRYFTLENRICKALYDIASKPPKEWKDIRVVVKRRDRDQMAYGAVQSALYAAAFTIQSFNMRAANNHVIQSFGAKITKSLQRRIWDHQPSGVHEFKVLPFNLHDEVLCPCLPDMIQPVRETVNSTVSEYRSKVPLLKLDWKINLKSWADK